MPPDAELLRRFAEEESQEAFAALVGRHLEMVYHAALRQVGGDTHRARDVAQVVFADLARKAGRLAKHGALAGWLHTSTRYAARHAVRTEQRRIAREQAARAMSEDRPNDAAVADWARVSPVLDEALHALSEGDRVAVLWRFFEGSGFAEIGERLALNEDAARMRVSRALEKLRGQLARRGIHSTAAGLTLALGQSAGALPAGLAASVTGTALSAAATAGMGAAILNFMSTIKLGSVAMGMLAAAGVGAAAFQTWEVREARGSLAAAHAERQALQTRIQELETQLQTATRLSRAADADNEAMAKAVAQVAASAKAEANAPLTQEVVQSRFNRARELARSGNWEAALPELLWCYDEGMVRISSFTGVRSSFLLSELGRLAKDYPPALAALRERRDRAEQRMLDDESDRRAPMDVAALNDALGEKDRNMVLFEQLPENDPRREGLLLRVYDDLIAERRYREAAAARPVAKIMSQFELMTAERPMPPGIPNPQMIRDANRRHVVTTTAKHIEVLAGAGDIASAQALATRLLAYDGSPETRRLVQEHAARAGQRELIQ